MIIISEEVLNRLSKDLNEDEISEFYDKLSFGGDPVIRRVVSDEAAIKVINVIVKNRIIKV